MRYLVTSLIAILMMVGCATEKKLPVPASPAPSSSSAPSAAPIADNRKAGDLADRMEIRCKKNSDKRTLITVPQDLGCTLVYNKFGKSATIAHSSAGTGYCDTLRARILKKLKSAGFSCE